MRPGLRATVWRYVRIIAREPFVEELRLNEARSALNAANSTIETVAESVGFKSADAFSRAFQRRFGVKPSVIASTSPSGRNEVTRR